MDFINKNKVLLLIITVFVLLVLLFQQCQEKRAVKLEQAQTTAFLNDSIEYYKTRLGNEVAEKSALKSLDTKVSNSNEVLQLLLSKQIDANGQLAELTKNYKRLNAAGKIGTELRIDSIEIEYPKPIDLEFSRRFNKETKWYSFSGLSTEKGITLEDFSVPANISFAIGDKKKSFWGTEYSFEATSDNPYIKINQLDGASFTQKQKRFGIGPYAGLDFRNLDWSAGVSASWHLIQF